jgi:hypothetical protein
MKGEAKSCWQIFCLTIFVFLLSELLYFSAHSQNGSDQRDKDHERISEAIKLVT